MGTVPVPYSPIAGDDATQARVLTWADAAAYLLGSATAGGSKRAFSAMAQNVAQSIPNNTETAVLLDSENVDNDNGHSTVTNTSRYTAQTSGWHIVLGQVTYASNATGVRHAKIRANGTTVKGVSIQGAVNGDFSIVPVVAFVFLNATEYIELTALQTSGGALNITNNFLGSSLFVMWVSN